MDKHQPLHVQQATRDDYPAIARLMADNFRGKFLVALGRDQAQRQRRMELLLPTGILCPGHLFVVYLDDLLAATFTLKLESTTPTTDDFRLARETLLPENSALRARWATTTLRLFGSMHLQTGEAYLDNLVVNKRVQHQGIAMRIVPSIYVEAQRLGCHLLYADVMSSNYRVIGLLKKANWEIVGRNYWLAPITKPLMGTAGILRIRKQLNKLEETTSSE